jgi:amino acid adenylation domain-containing protein
MESDELTGLSPLHAGGSPDATCAGALSPAQRPAFEERDPSAQLAWWRRELEGAGFLMELPADRRRPPAQSGGAAQHVFALDASIASELMRWQREEQATAFTTLFAAFAALLFRYTGLTDMLIGTARAPQASRSLHEVTGSLASAVVIRVRFGAAASFRELVRQVRARSTAAFEHQGVPFESLLVELGVVAQPSHHPVFQTALLECTEMPAPPGGILSVDPCDTAAPPPRLDLSLSIEQTRSEIRACWEYNTDLFESATIDRATTHFKTLLASLLRVPDQPLAAARYLDAAEVSVLEGWSGGLRKACASRPVHRLFEHHARVAPWSLAVAQGGTSVSYAELNTWAERIAARLRLTGVKRDDLVGICAERTIGWIAGLLGILKTGAGYLSLDPRYPPERLRLMITDAGLRAVCVGEGLTGPFETSAAVLLDLDRCRDEEPAQTPTPETAGPAVQELANSAAYAVYTSGSTGRPKAVVLCHGALSNLIRWHTETYRITPADRASQFARMGFDASVWEIWPYLANGASVHILKEEERLSPRDVVRFVIDNRITIGFFPPVIAESMLVQPWPPEVALRALLTGGDRLLTHPPRGLPFRYYNHYGPSEATVTVTAGEVLPRGAAAAAPTIGRPLDNARVLLLDDNLERVPALCTGEVYIGGDMLGRGYLNQPALTAERFVPDPFSDRAGARMYRTGDLARYEADGEIAFVGRSDGQVKINGFRIELGEIESVLMQQPGIEGAAVVVRESAGQTQLAAYLVARDEKASDDELRTALRRGLPEFMVPAFYAYLDQLPLTPNGKLMRAALPEIEPAPPAGGVSATGLPASELERGLAAIWEEVLQVPAVGVDHNFFDLGGQSITLVRVQELIRQRLEVHVPIAELLRNGTISELAQYLEPTGTEAADNVQR